MADTSFFGSDELNLGPGSDDSFEVYQDSFEPIDYTSTMTNTAPMPDFSSIQNPRRPLGAANSNTILKPHPVSQWSASPSKAKSTSHPQAPLGVSKGNKLNKMSMPPPGQAPQTDSLKKKPVLSNFNTRPKKTSMDATTQFISQNPIFSTGSTGAPQSTAKRPLNSNGKRERELMEAPLLLSDADASDQAKNQSDQQTTVPRWDSFPPIIDDGLKPNHSYAQMIAMAILRSPTGKLTLSQIYKWISDTFSHYNPNDPGWQNSIRHNLSLHKAFRKVLRPKSDPGKGNYWAIEPGAEGQFLKEKPKGRSAPSAENLPVMSTRLEPSVPVPIMPTSEPVLPPPGPSHHNSHMPPPTQIMPSSDATIPELDSCAPEEPTEPPTNTDPLFDAVPFSPCPPGVSSSPPISKKHGRTLSGTPGTGGHIARPRRKTAESVIGDSGYISSLDSSVVRATHASRPRKKRKSGASGRAEVEIARLRNSSPFSPTKSRSKSAFQPVSSSPLRHSPLRQTTALLNPLTPPVKMKPPVLPPPSVSPNTNLRNHRNKVQSMLRDPASRISDEETYSWSPKFNIDDAAFLRGTDDYDDDDWLGPSDRATAAVYDENDPANTEAWVDDFPF